MSLKHILRRRSIVRDKFKIGSCPCKCIFSPCAGHFVNIVFLLFFLDHIHSLGLLIHRSFVAVARISSLLSSKSVSRGNQVIWWSTAGALFKYTTLHKLSAIVLFGADYITFTVLLLLQLLDCGYTRLWTDTSRASMKICLVLKSHYILSLVFIIVHSLELDFGFIIFIISRVVSLFQGIRWLSVGVHVLSPILKCVPWYFFFHDLCLNSFLALSGNSFPKFLKQIPLLSFNLCSSPKRCGTARRANILLFLIPLSRLQPTDFGIIRPPSNLLLDVLEVQLGVGL